MLKKFLSILLASVAIPCITVVANTPNRTDSVYIFTYHSGPATDGIKLAYSIDKHFWTPISNYSFVKSDFGNWGANKKMYSPSLLCDGGKWYAIWSVNPDVKQFATTYTADFWTWKPQDYPYVNQGDNVVDPILTKQAQDFIVSYRTNKNTYFETRSTDFKKWSTASAISEQTYRQREKVAKVLINGTEQVGEIHRAPSALVQELEMKVGDAAQRNQSYNESTREDAQRFAQVKALKGTLNINTQNSKPISQNLIGIFFEDINYSADGGLYAELIQNRDFEYSHLDRNEWNAKSYWELKGEGTTFDIATDQPIHANNSHYAVLNTTQPGAALQNNGFDGIVLKQGDKYNLSLFLKSLNGKNQRVKVQLLDGDKVLAQTTLTASTAWKQLKATLKATASVEKATLSIQPQTAGKLAIDFVSLFPQKTFKGRKNGMRPDLAQTLADLHPRFVRFPGGCVSHGNGLENMYRWNATIGPLWERKGQSNLWGYHQSLGIGFYEYFQFCEDIGAEPLPVLPAAVPCQNSSRGGFGQQGGLPWEQMDDYAQELLNLIEWANGDPKTSKWAKLRLEAGHPKPFNLKMIGVGNEDLISDVFEERFIYLNKRIKEKYPDIQVVGTVGPFFEGSDYEAGWELARKENIDIVDEHYYVNPGWYIHSQNYYDKYDRKGTKVYLGEWASRGNQLENALAEALHITNLERNADVVIMSSYAPLLAKHGHTQWNPDLIYFNNTSVMPTVNYQVQKLCGNNSGSQYIYSNLKVDAISMERNQEVARYNEAASKRISSSVVKDEKTGDLILKLVNITPVPADLQIDFDNWEGYASEAELSVISGNPSDRDNKPNQTTLSVSEKFSYQLPAYSFSVIRLKKITN